MADHAGRPEEITDLAGRRRPTLRERQKASTRRALLQGAKEAFEEHGYAATIEDIAARAGTSRGTFYLYFSKSEALAELLAEAFIRGAGEDHDDTAALRDFTHLPAFTLDQMRRWIAAYVRRWEKHRLLGRAWVEGDVQDPAVQAATDARLQRTVDELADVIVGARTAAGLPITRTEAVARAACMDLQLQFFTYHVVLRGLDVDFKAGVDAVAESWYVSIFGTTTPDGAVVVAGPRRAHSRLAESA